jgi:hypothetical protein
MLAQLCRTARGVRPATVATTVSSVARRWQSGVGDGIHVSFKAVLGSTPLTQFCDRAYKRHYHLRPNQRQDKQT